MRGWRKSVAGKTRPAVTAVVRHVHAAPETAGMQIPAVNVELPGAGEERPRIARVHREIGAARAVVHREHLLPRRAAVGGVVDAALALWTKRLSDGAHVHRIRIARIDDDSRDVSRGLEPGVLPRPARVSGLVNAVAERVVGTNEPRLAGAGPHDIVRRGRDGERANRRDVLLVEDRLPGGAAVRGLPDAAVRRTRIDGHSIAGNAGDRSDAVPFGPERSKVQ